MYPASVGGVLEGLHRHLDPGGDLAERGVGLGELGGHLGLRAALGHGGGARLVGEGVHLLDVRDRGEAGLLHGDEVPDEQAALLEGAGGEGGGADGHERTGAGAEGVPGLQQVADLDAAHVASGAELGDVVGGLGDDVAGGAGLAGLDTGGVTAAGLGEAGARFEEGELEVVLLAVAGVLELAVEVHHEGGGVAEVAVVGVAALVGGAVAELAELVTGFGGGVAEFDGRGAVDDGHWGVS